MSWRQEAACIDEPTDVFFPAITMGRPKERPEYDEALAICGRCPVREECLAEALATEQGVSKTSRHGVFGGLTPEQRWALAVGGDSPTCATCREPFLRRQAGQQTCGRHECIIKNRNSKTGRRDGNREWMRRARADGRVA